jgi:hypothetical protein
MVYFESGIYKIAFAISVCGVLAGCGDKSGQTQNNKFNVSDPASLAGTLSGFKKMPYGDRCRLMAETNIEAAKIRDKDKKATIDDNYLYVVRKYEDADSLGLMLKSLSIAYENKHLEPDVLGAAFLQKCLQDG